MQSVWGVMTYGIITLSRPQFFNNKEILMKYWLTQLVMRFSLLRIAQTLYYGIIPLMLLLAVIIVLNGCSFLEIVPRKEKLPKIQVNSPYVDDAEIKFDKGGIILKMEWEI